MKLFYSMLLCGCLSATCLVATAQTHTARQQKIGNNCNGYYEYLPEGYSAAASYPVIIFLHGADNRGNGGSQLKNLLSNGIPKVIDDGDFPKTFTVKQQTHRFIVISPQFRDWPVTADLKDVIAFVNNKYAVQNGKLYVTGPSMGGGLIWDFAGESVANASSMAAVVPVCGLSDHNSTKVANIAAAKLAVWATHNQGDELVDVNKTSGYVNAINAQEPAVTAKMTIFDTVSHDAWTKTYHPAFVEEGNNIYEWMLLHPAADESTLPVELSSYEAYASGRVAVMEWATSTELNHDYFVAERSANGRDFYSFDTIRAIKSATGYRYRTTDNEARNGHNFYRLKQFDVDGTVTVFDVLKVTINNAGGLKAMLYPNPASRNLYVRLDTSAGAGIDIHVMLLHVSGASVTSWRMPATGSVLTLNLPPLMPGHYLLRITRGKFSSSHQVMLQ